MNEKDQNTLNQASTISRIMTFNTRQFTSKARDGIKGNHNSLKQLNMYTSHLSKSKKDLQRFAIKSSKKLSQTGLIKNIDENSNKNREEKFNLDQLGRIEYAKEHSSANRPLNKLREFKTNQKFCRCCGLPCITPGVIEPFRICDNTDKYSILGQAISLYFSFYKFSIFILLVLLCSLIIPSFYMISTYYISLSNLCNNIFANNRSIGLGACENFITNKDYLKANNKEGKETFQSQLNAANLKSYIEFYTVLMSNSSNSNDDNSISDIKKEFGKKMNKLVINNSISYFIVLVCLFIINLLYIVFQNNKILDYNFQLISPSDYAVIMTNMSNTLKSFHHLKKSYTKNNKVSSYREFRRKLGFKDNELNDKSITEANEFGKYIENIIINKKNKDDKKKSKDFKVQLVNICYKLNKFKILESEILEFKNQLFQVANNPRQIRRNRHFKLEGNKRKFFKTPLSVLNQFNLNTNCCEKKIPITVIMKEKKKKETQLNGLLEASKKIKAKNFANVAFISFNTISEQEKFLSKYSQNWLQTLILILKYFKYYFCFCCLSKESKKKWENERGETVFSAPEPDDIIFENLETTKFGRIIRTFTTTLISLMIIAISFIIVVLLTLAQERIDKMSFGAKNFSKYAVSLGMTGAISIVNIIFQSILESLTRLEKHMSITDHNLSFSVKLTVFTFVNSAIVPLISNLFTNLDVLSINYELLVSNMLMMFLVNSFVSPIMWTFNVMFYIKKWTIWTIESKKNPNMRHNRTQRELNDLYEFVDIELAYKYSYISKTLLMTFFYLPVFPLGIVFSICGLFLGFYLEKYNIAYRYKRPEMMNEAICKFYANFFEVNFLMLSLGDYVFLQDKYRIDYWPYINLSVFFILLIIPYGQYLSFNFIGINQSQIINKGYNDVYFTFYNDYERMNPFTKKIGTINYLKRLREKDYISEEEFENQKKQIEKLTFMQIMAQARPNKTNRVKRSLGKKLPLMSNVMLDDNDKNPRRLFELIKKLYRIEENDNNNNNKDDDNDSSFIGNDVIFYRNKRIPNIIHLVGHIFGTEEEESSSLSGSNETENEVTEKKFLRDKKSLKNIRKLTQREKERNPSPFVFTISNNDKDKDNILKKNNIVEENKLKDTDNKVVTTNNKNNLIDHSSNIILSEIKSEISKGGKNLFRFTNSTSGNKDLANNITNNITNNIQNSNDNMDDNIIQIDNSNSKNNSEKEEKKMFPFISNISVTINQFFEGFKSSSKDEEPDYFNSDRIKIDSNDNDNEIEMGNGNDSMKKCIKKYIINQKKMIPLKKEKDNDNKPEQINNIINIVLNNDNQ